MREGEGSQGRVGSLATILESAMPLSPDDRAGIVEQALALMEGFYVHLPLKRAMHAVDPVQRLRLLRHRLASDGDAASGIAFHREMTEIFTSVRDLHTVYLLPSPYRRLTATLPFAVEECFDDDGRRHYLVTKTENGFDHPTLVPGTEVTHWNGVPIHLAVERNGDRHSGSNRAARHARGLNSLTQRPLTCSLPPDESWIVVTHRTSDGDVVDERLAWDVRSPEPGQQAVDPDHPSNAATALGYDIQSDAVHEAKKNLFAPDAVEFDRRIALGEAGALAVGDSLKTSMPTVFLAKPVKTTHGTYGYIRIFTFGVGRSDLFVAEFLKLTESLPEDGLIIDVRGNPGGLIYAAEDLLQLLTPNRIEPARFQFINTSQTRALTQAYSDPSLPQPSSLKPWAESVASAVKTGAAFSVARPMSDPDRCNAIGQRVHGPVVLITDALCYSATDIFAAGFQDHGIGPILGCSDNTGAGGANVWSHAVLCQLMPTGSSSIHPLSVDAGMNAAVRRSVRVGPNAGTLLEDLGVVPDERHWLTRRDVLEGNPNLIEHASKILSRRRPYRLSITSARVSGGTAEITLDTKNLSSVDIHVDGHTRDAIEVADGETAVSIEVGEGSGTLDFKGFDDEGRLSASRSRRI